jgi:hypothetical protein
MPGVWGMVPPTQKMFRLISYQVLVEVLYIRNPSHII